MYNVDVRTCMRTLLLYTCTCIHVFEGTINQLSNEIAQNYMYFSTLPLQLVSSLTKSQSQQCTGTSAMYVCTCTFVFLVEREKRHAEFCKKYNVHDMYMYILSKKCGHS